MFSYVVACSCNIISWGIDDFFVMCINYVFHVAHATVAYFNVVFIEQLVKFVVSKKVLINHFRNWFPTFIETFYVAMWFLRFCCLFLDFAYRFLLLIDNKKSVFRQFWEWMWKVHEIHSFHHEIRKIYHTIQFQWFCNERNALRTRLSYKLVITVSLLFSPIWKLKDFFVLSQLNI